MVVLKRVSWPVAMKALRAMLVSYALVVGFVDETGDFLEDCPFCDACNGTCVMNATFARACPVNSWTLSAGAVSLGECFCLSGFKWENASVCVPCNESEYCPWGESSSPVACPQGCRCTKTDKFPIPGTFDDNGTFRICPAGYRCWTNWSTEPLPCGDGGFCPEGSSESIPCPEGTFCHWNASEPVPCDVGFTCPAMVGEPIPCDAGYFCPWNQSTEKVLCPLGFSCPVQSSAPTLCSPGALCPNGTGDPVACPGGWFCPDPAGDALVCDAGFVCPPGSDWPVSCPAGAFCVRGASAAETCPVNFYCPANTSAPLPCPPSYICPRGSATPVRTTTPAATTTPALAVCGNGFVRDITGRECVAASNVSYASLVSVVFPENVTVVTASDLEALTASIAQQSGCNGMAGCKVVVLAITNADGVTVYCTNGVCPGFNRRRLLATGGQFQIVVGVVAEQAIPGDLVFELYAPGTQVALECTYVKSTKVDNTLLSEVQALIVYVKGATTVSTFPVVPLVGGIVGGCCAVLVVLGVVWYRRRASRAVFVPPTSGAEFTMTKDCIPVRIIIQCDVVCHAKAT